MLLMILIDVNLIIDIWVLFLKPLILKLMCKWFFIDLNIRYLHNQFIIYKMIKGKMLPILLLVWYYK